MACMNQDKKKNLAPKIKEVLKKFGVKASIGVSNHSTLVVNVKSSALDIIGNYNDIISAKPGNRFHSSLDYLSVNTYWIDDQFEGEAKDFLNELKDAMNGVDTDDANFNKSDIQSDYFHVGWYIDINIGKWDKPYSVVA